MQNIRQRVLTGLGIGFVVIVALLLVADLRQLSGQLGAFPLILVPAILAGTLVNYALRFVKWHYYLTQVDIPPLAVGRSARIFLAGFPLAVTPGKVGEAMKAVWLHRATGASVARGVPVVLAERVSDGLAMLVLSTLGILAFPRYLPAFLAASALLIGLILVLQTRPLALWMLSIAERVPLVERFAHDLHEFYDGAYQLFRPKSNTIAVLLGTLAWTGEGLATYLVLLGLGVEPGWRILTLAIFVLALSTIVGALSALPGGLGASEITMAGMFTFVLDMPTSQAAAATLLVRLMTLWFGVATGFAAWAVWRRELFSTQPEPSKVEPHPERASLD